MDIHFLNWVDRNKPRRHRLGDGRWLYWMRTFSWLIMYILIIVVIGFIMIMAFLGGKLP